MNTSDGGLRPEYSQFLNIDNEEQLKVEIDHLVRRLAIIAQLRRADGNSIDAYIKDSLEDPKSGYLSRQPLLQEGDEDSAR